MKYLQCLIIIVHALVFSQKTKTNPDILYQKFSKAYEQLNFVDISKLYSNNAEIINLYDEQLPNSYKGQEGIKAFYKNYFETVIRQNQRMRLTFKIVERKLSKNTLFDYGYFLLEITPQYQAPIKFFGKFYTCLVNKNCEWKFKTDTATNATEQEYLNSKGRIIE